MDRAVGVYERSLDASFKKVEKIMIEHELNSDIKKEYEKILSLSCKNIINKWRSGKKYIRTVFVYNAYQDEYPEEILKTSIFLDVMVNILDDLLDEDLLSEERKLYILEFLRVYALHNCETIPEEIRLAIGNYFFQLISLAIVENHFNSCINEGIDIDGLIEKSIKVLDCRSMDIDIFNELAFVGNNNYDEKERDGLRCIARFFRAVNIMKKDIDDMDHDRKTGQESLALNIYDNKRCDFEAYVLAICGNYLDESKKIVDRNKNNETISRFFSMIQKEAEYIRNKIKI